MFAFLVAGPDGFCAARDPLGIKPLYLARANGSTYFASELKALLPFTLQVEEFPPGHWYDSATGALHRYYSVPEPTPCSAPLEQWIERLRATFRESVRKRLMSDVPLGVFLSGGIDSSLVAALVADMAGEVHSFSVATADAPDRLRAQAAAKHLGTRHHERLYTPEEVERALPEIIYHLESYDSALVRSAAPNYFLAELASEWVKVVLSGEGADELFAGYHYLKAISDPAALARELWRITDGLHNVNLQRLDRMTMAHGLEGRVPFLDTAMIALAAEMPTELKITPDERVEKWILRVAFEDLLPQEIIWRRKEEFGDGSGASEVIDGLAERHVTDRDFERLRQNRPDLELQSKADCYCFHLFREHFGDAPAVVRTVGRWVGMPPAQSQEETVHNG